MKKENVAAHDISCEDKNSVKKMSTFRASWVHHTIYPVNNTR